MPHFFAQALNVVKPATMSAVCGLVEPLTVPLQCHGRLSWNCGRDYVFYVRSPNTEPLPFPPFLGGGGEALSYHRPEFINQNQHGLFFQSKSSKVYAMQRTL